MILTTKAEIFSGTLKQVKTELNELLSNNKICLTHITQSIRNITDDTENKVGLVITVLYTEPI